MPPIKDAVRRFTRNAWEREADLLLAEAKEQAEHEAVRRENEARAAERKRIAYIEAELDRFRRQAADGRSSEVRERIAAAMGSFMPRDVFREARHRLQKPLAIERFAVQPNVIGPGVPAANMRRAFNPLSRYYAGAVVPMDVADAPVSDVAWDWAVAQGGVGTPFALVPQVEVKKGLDPYSLRGLSYDQGEMDRMYRGHPVVQSAIDRRSNLLSRATWEFEAPDVDPLLLRYMGMSADALKWQADELNAEFVSTARADWSDVRREMIQTGGVAGFALFEFGLDPFEAPGFRLRWVEPRTPSTVMAWVLDSRERIVGFTQTLPNGQYAPRTAVPVVDIRKCLYFANRRTGANAEGISDLRSSWTWAKVMAEFIQSALLNRQRFGPGVPVVNVQSQTEITAESIIAAQRSCENYVNSSDATLTAPAGITFDLLQVQADSALVPVVEMCAKFQREGLDVVLFGMGSGDASGSRALGEVKSDLHLSALEGFATGPASAFSRMGKTIIEAVSGEQPVYPTMKLRGLTTRSATETLEIYAGVQKLRSDGAPVGMVRAAAKAAGLDPDEVAPLSVGEDSAPQPQMLPVGSLTAGLQAAQSMYPVGVALPPNVVGVFLEGAGFNADQVSRIVQAATPATPEAAQSPGNVLGADVEANAKPAERIQLRAVPDKYQHIDFKPSQGMVEAAKRAQRVRASKPPSERGMQGMGLARMRDIINGETLSPTTWRVMAAWFARHEVDKRGSTWGEQGKGWQAWNGWGGDEGQRRAEKIVGQMNAADEADTRMEPAVSLRYAADGCSCGECDTVSLRAPRPRPPRIKSVCRDGVFVTFRALTPREQAVAFNTIEAIIEQATKDAIPELEYARRLHRQAFIEAANPILTQFMPDPLAVSQVDVDFTPLYLDVLTPHVAEAYELAYGDAEDEFKAVAKNQRNVSQPQRAGAPRMEQVEAQALLAAQRLNMRTLEDLRGLAASVATGAPRSQLTRASMGLGHQTISGIASAMISAVGAARDQAASDGPRVTFATVSEVMDYMTCPPCAEDDGKRMRYPSAEYERMKPPNPRCRSVINSRGASNLCRRVMMYDFAEDTAVPPPFGDGRLVVTGDVSARAASGSAAGEPLSDWTPDSAAVNLLFVVGPPATGKSTAAREVKGRVEASGANALVVSLDDLLGIDNGELWTSAKSSAAHVLGVEEVIDALNGAEPGDVIVYDAPLGSEAVRKRVLTDVLTSVSEEQAAKLRVTYAEPDPSLLANEVELLRRNASRPEGRRIDDGSFLRYLRGFQSITPDETELNGRLTFGAVR